MFKFIGSVILFFFYIIAYGFFFFIGLWLGRKLTDRIDFGKLRRHS